MKSICSSVLKIAAIAICIMILPRFAGAAESADDGIISTAPDGKIIYVDSDATGNGDGSSWQDAYTSIQVAIDAARPNDHIRLKGDYVLTEQLLITNASVRISGGYTGDGDSVSGRSVLTRDAAVNIRIARITNSVVYAEGLVISNGCCNEVERIAEINSKDIVLGQGISALHSDLSLSNCVFAANSYDLTVQYFHGGAVGMYKGSLHITDCHFISNRIGKVSDLYGCAHGADVYSKDAQVVEVLSSTFEGGLCRTHSAEFFGVGLALVRQSNNEGVAVVSNCVFRGMEAKRSVNPIWSNHSRGTAITAIKFASVKIEDCRFFDNINSRKNSGGAYTSQCGTLYFDGNSTASVVRSVLYGNGSRRTGVPIEGDCGSICLQSGSLSLTNVLQAGCAYGDGVEIFGGNLNAYNCTFAAITNGYAIRIAGNCEALFENCILSGEKGAYIVTSGNMPTINRCLATEELPGLENIVGEPLFGDDAYFHPKSKVGRCIDGYFTGNEWTYDAIHCVSIDAGNPEDCGLEQQPNGHRGNIGYDAQMPTASKSYLGEPTHPVSLAAYIYQPKLISASSVGVSGEICNGGGNATVTFYYGPSDGGTDVSAWANSKQISGVGDWQLLKVELSGIESTAYMRIKAEADGNTAWSETRTCVLVRPPALADVRVTHMTRNTARVRCKVVDDGGADTKVRVRFWYDDTLNASVYEYNLGQPVNNGEEIDMVVNGFIAGKTYKISVEAVNVSGVATETIIAQTLSDTPIKFYVTPEGAGMQDGSSWANAFSKVQDAIDVAIVKGDEICLKEGDYEDFGFSDINYHSQALIKDKPGLVIRGGYAGEGLAMSGRSVLLRNLIADNPDRRHFSIKDSTITFRDLIFTNGNLSANANCGSAINADNSSLTLENCDFLCNKDVIRDSKLSAKGGACYVSGGSLVVSNCLFKGNSLDRYSTAYSASGAAIHIEVGTVLTCIDSEFCDNKVLCGNAAGSGGAAIYVVRGGKGKVIGCKFTNNEARQNSANAPRYGCNGGTIYFDGGWGANHFEIVDCNFVQNCCSSIAGSGGILNVTGSGGCSASFNRVSFVDCGVDSSGVIAPTFGYSKGDVVYDSKRTLAMTNVLMAGNYGAQLLQVRNGTVNAVNCTFAGNFVGYGVVVDVSGVAAKMFNSIIWGNAAGGTNTVTGPIELMHCNSQDGADAANDVISVNPMFRNPDKFNYKLASSSPCKNRGINLNWTRDDIDLAGKKRVRGGIVDLGAYEVSDDGFSIRVR